MKNIFLFIILFSFSFFSCNDQRKINDKLTTVSVSKSVLSDSACMESLQQATIITVKEALFSLEKYYDIYADGIRVGYVKGKFFPMFGDIFTLFTINDTSILIEKEIKRGFRFSFNRLAVIMTPDEQEIGFISENKWQDMFNWGYVFHVYDINQNELGQSRQQFSLWLKENMIYNSNGQPEYKVTEQLTFIQDTYNIQVAPIDKNISIPVAIFLVCIEDAIKDHEESKSKKKK